MGSNLPNPSATPNPAIAAQQMEQQKNWQNEQQVMNSSMNAFNSVDSALNQGQNQEDPRLSILKQRLPGYGGMGGI